MSDGSKRRIAVSAVMVAIAAAGMVVSCARERPVLKHEAEIRQAAEAIVATVGARVPAALPVEVGADRVQVWVDLQGTGIADEQVPQLTEAMCRGMIEALMGMGINPGKEDVWVDVHAIASGAGMSPTGEPLVRDFGESSYNPSEDRIVWEETRR